MQRSSILSLLFPDIYRDSDFCRWLRISAVAFVVMSVGSYIIGMLMPDLSEKIYGIMSESAQNAELRDDAGNIAAVPLFLHNIRAMVFTILYGLIPFLHLPALLLGVNAMSLGFVGAYCVDSGIPLFTYLVGVIPHGIFELSALVLSLSAGFYLCTHITRRIRTKEKGIVRAALIRTVQLLLLHILPLLLIAALVETYITTALLRSLM